MIPYRNLEFLDASLFGQMGHAHFIVYHEDKSRPVYLLEFLEMGWKVTEFPFPNRDLTERYLATGKVLATNATASGFESEILPSGWTFSEFLVAMAMFEQGKKLDKTFRS